MRHAPCSCVDSPGDASHDIVIAGLHPRYGDDEPSLEGGGADRPEDFVLCDGDDEPCLECGGTDRPDDFVLCDGCDQGGHVNCVGLTSVPEGNWFCGRCEAPSGPGAADTRTAGLRAHAATLATENARLRRDLARAMAQLDVGGAGGADRVKPRERPSGALSDYEGEEDEMAVDSAGTSDSDSDSDSVFDLSGGCEVKGYDIPVVFLPDTTKYDGTKYGPVGRGKYFARLPRHDQLPGINDIFKSREQMMPGGRPIRVLDLCCGTKALRKVITRYYNSRGFQVEYIGLDWNADAEPEIRGNVTNWRHLLRRYKQGYFDFIWASPECKKFSNGRQATTKVEMNEAMEYVRACKECILYFGPPSWVIENPDAKLKHQAGMFPGKSKCPLMRHCCRFTISYCRYGTLYQKDTLLWTNMVGLKLLRCTAACTRCAPLHGGLATHSEVAQLGPSMSTGAAGVGAAGVNKLYAPPDQLLVTICVYAIEQARGWRRRCAYGSTSASR